MIRQLPVCERLPSTVIAETDTHNRYSVSRIPTALVSRHCEQYACVICDKDENDQFKIPKGKKKVKEKKNVANIMIPQILR